MMSKEREDVLEIADFEGERATDEQVGAYLVTELDIAESKANGFNDDHCGKAQSRADAACLRRLMDVYEHYQPLLDAKDAEIERLTDIIEMSDKYGAKWLAEKDKNTTLKALLEQAREALSRIAESEYDYMTGKHSDEVAEETLAAINAATGEK